MFKVLLQQTLAVGKVELRQLDGERFAIGQAQALETENRFLRPDTQAFRRLFVSRTHPGGQHSGTRLLSARAHVLGEPVRRISCCVTLRWLTKVPFPCSR